MAVPASWIRQNMFPSSFDESNREPTPNRRLTEAEVRVKRSLEKLSIPEWYLNNSSNPPKILMNDTPIESRPASWKNYGKNSSMSALTPKNFKGSSKSFSTEPPSPSSYKFSRKSQRSYDSSTKSSEAITVIQNTTLERRKQKKRLNTSGTFPRMSVSRKIQNINIVFPPSPKLELSIDALDESKFSSTMDDPSSESKPIMVTDLDDPDPECLRHRRGTYTKPSSPDCSFAPCRTQDFNSPALMKFKVRTASTPQGSPVSIFSTSTMDSSISQPIRPDPTFAFPEIISCSPLAKPLKTPSFFFPPVSIPEPKYQTLMKPLRRSPLKPPKEAPPPPPSCSPPPSPKSQTPRRASPRPSNNAQALQICDSCKADNVRIRLVMVSPSRSPRESPTFRSPLPPITEDEKCQSLSRQNSNAANLAFLLSKNKSATMEKIIQKKRVSEKRSLVQEIIEELEEKCRTSPQPTYSTPGSRNFVRKLVKALERNEDGEDQKNAVFQCNQEVEYNSEGSSDADIKSAASSTSLSFKDSESDSEPRSPTLSSEPDYDWVAEAKREEEKLKEEEEESVFWVPVKKSLPRTSSMLSMLTSSGSGRQSPCMSPIRTQRGVKVFQWGNALDTWGNTHRRTRNQMPKKLFRIDESGVPDSGYSDRSERSSATDNVGTWSDFESTRSPSDLESFSGSYSRTRKAFQDKSAFMGTSILV